MKQWLRRVTAKLSLFWQYFFLLSLVVCTFLMAFRMAVQQSGRSLQEAYLDQVTDAFYDNCEAFSEALLRTNNLFSAIEESGYYLQSSRARYPLTPEDYFCLSKVQGSF